MTGSHAKGWSHGSSSLRLSSGSSSRRSRQREVWGRRLLLVRPDQHDVLVLVMALTAAWRNGG